MDIYRHTHHEAGGKADVDGGDLGGEAVATDDDLFVFLVEMVEGVEKLFLAFFFANYGLEIVDDEDVDTAVFICEAVEFFTHGFDEVVVELLGGYVEDFEVFVFFG